MYQHIYLSLLSFCLLFGGSFAQADWIGDGSLKLSVGKGLLWQVSREGAPTSYLFGTIHSHDKRLLPLPEPVNEVFAKVDSLALELDLSLANQLAAAQQMYLPQGESLIAMLGKTSFMTLAEALGERGIMVKDAMRLQPWAAYMLLSLPKGGLQGEFLDLYLYQQAKKQQKTVHGLETPQEQLGVFSQFSREEQLDMLREGLKLLDEQETMLDTLHELYLQRDLDGLLSSSRKHLIEYPHALNEQLMQALVVKRNLLMAERIEPHLQTGNILIAVGALHLPGAGGLIDLLRQRGWQINAIY